jgi:peptidoglycan hydrolase-like protein with peptidoglycan-binding domain
VDGIYGERTAQATRAFQELYGLTVTGAMDEATYSLLYDTYRGYINSLPNSQFVGTARPYPGFPLTTGQSGEFVTALQTYLVTISRTYPEIPEISIDGAFGQATRNAVIAYQNRFGLTPDGIVGLRTWESIGSLYSDLVKGESVVESQHIGGAEI